MRNVCGPRAWSCELSMHMQAAMLRGQCRAIKRWKRTDRISKVIEEQYRSNIRTIVKNRTSLVSALKPPSPLTCNRHINIMHIFSKSTIRFVTVPVIRTTMTQVTRGIITVSVLTRCHPCHPQQCIASRRGENFVVVEIAHWPATAGKIVVKAELPCHESLAKLFIVLHWLVHPMAVFVEFDHLNLFWAFHRRRLCKTRKGCVKMSVE